MILIFKFLIWGRLIRLDWVGVGVGVEIDLKAESLPLLCVCVLVALSYVPVGLIVYVVVGDKDDEAITTVTYHSSYEV